MKSKFNLLFPFMIALSAVACKQNNSTGSQTLTDSVAIPDSVLVPVSVAKKYVNNYAEHADSVAIDTLLSSEAETGRPKPRLKPRPDTRCIWFSKERLAAVLQQLEKEKGSGVRFYLATYDKRYNLNPTAKDQNRPEKQYWGYNTLIMVSTRDTTTAVGKIHQDYYTNFNPDMIAGTNQTKKGRNGFIVGFTPENRGELCPPPESCYDFGATLLSKN